MQLKLFTLSPLLLALGLSGCQITNNENDSTHIEKIANDDIAAVELCSDIHETEEAIADCELAREGVIDVVHPNDDILTESAELLETEQVIKETAITDVWERASANFQLYIPEEVRINTQRKWYLKHPEYMSRVVKRAKPFLYYIVEEIEKRDMPMELVLLPIVESAFDPFAYSHGRAAGMWQFIPGTGKRFGMAQTWWYDGRRDVIASTQGALDYLTYLNKMFDGNWLHALAAYNSGEGRVLRAIKNNKRAGKPIDFWNLSLPRETRAYVPKLLALADILKNKEEYTFKWPEVENQAVIETVDIGSQVDLAFAAELADISLKELHSLNPGFNRWATSPDGPHRLVLPLSKAEAFSEALAKIDKKERLNWVRHKVKPGDSLIKIAKQYHTTVKVIKQVNEIRGTMIRIGDPIMVPVALQELDSYSLSQEQRLASLQSNKTSKQKIQHKVQSGDTLWDLSRKYKVGTKQLAKWNGMAPGDMLHPGKTLVVWLEGKSDAGVTKKLTYTVRNGDSLSRIASKFNIKVSDISKWNGLNTKRYLQPGQKLKLYVDVTRLSASG